MIKIPQKQQPFFVALSSTYILNPYFMNSLNDRFKQVNEDYNKFELIQNKRSQRADIHAFLILDELQPGNKDLISATGHDIIFLDVNVEKLNIVITDEQILELVRSGVMYDREYDCLAMFM